MSELKAGYFSIEALLDDEKFQEGLNRLVGTANQTQQKTQSVFDKIGSGFKSVAKYTAVGVGAFSMLTAAVGKLVSEYEEKEAAERKLGAVMKSMGTYTEQAHAEFVAFARDMQKSTNYADDQVNKTLATLATFSNLSNETIKRAAKVSLDMGELLGGDAAIQIGKALQDKELVTSLKRVGVNIDVDKVKMMNMDEYQKYVLKELETEFGGIAEASVNPVKQLKNEISDIMASTGKALIPLFSMLTGLLKPLMEGIAGVVGFFSDILSPTTNISNSVKELRISVQQYNTEIAKADATDKLISKYDELSAKTNRTTAEQTELNNITNSLAKAVPSAVTAWNQYGKALGIVSSEAKKLNDANRVSAEETLNAQVKSTLSESKKVAENWRKLRVNRETAGMDYSNISYDMNNAGTMGQDVTMSADERKKAAQEMQRLQLVYDEVKGSMLRLREVSAGQIQDMYDIAKATNRTTLSQEAFAQSFRHMNEQMNKIGYTGLNNANRQKLFEYSEQLAKQGITGDKKDKLIAELATKLKAAEKQQFKFTGGKIEDITGKLAKLHEELEWLKTTEIEIKIKDNIKKVLDQFEKLTGNDRTLILRTYQNEGQDSGDSMLKARLKAQGYGTTAQNQAISVMNRVRIQNEEELKKNLETVSQTYKDFINANNDIAKSFASIDVEKRKQIENLIQWEGAVRQQLLIDLTKKQQAEQAQLIQWEITEKEKALMSLSGAELANRLKAIETETAERQKAMKTNQAIQATQANQNVSQEFANRKKAVDRMSDGQKADEILQKIQSVSSSAMALAQSKTVGQGITNAGNLASNIPVVGGYISKVSGIIGGIVDFFSEQGETAQQKWQRLFDGMKGAIDYQLYQQNEVLRVMQRQAQLNSYIDKLLGDDNSLAAQMKKSNLEASIQKASAYSINGVAVSDMTDAEKIQAYQTAQEKKAKADDAKALAEFYKTQLTAMIQDAGVDYRTGTHDINPEGWAMYAKYQELLNSYGVGTYSIHDVLDKYGTPIEDMNQNMAVFQEKLRQIIEGNQTDLSLLENYADAQAELLAMEQKETDELSEQLNIQNKLNDTIKDRLRALKDERINALLDKLSDVEYQIATGQITQAQGNLAMSNIESQIANQLQATGNTGLMQQVLAARAELLKASNSNQFNTLAGKGNIVSFDTGGTVSKTGLAKLHEGEYVLTRGQHTDWLSLSAMKELVSKGVGNSIESTNIEINPSFVITVANDTDIYKVEKAVESVFKDIENRTGKKILI